MKFDQRLYDITQWQEKKFRFVGLTMNPGDHSTDNGLLFTATAAMLGIGDPGQPLWRDLANLCRECQNANGTLNRYPGDRALESWDDLTGVAAVLGVNEFQDGNTWAESLLKAGGWFGYFDNTGVKGFKWGAWLGRFPGFIPHLKLCAGEKLWFLGQLWLGLSFLGVFFDKPTDTSGKCLAYLRVRAVTGKHWLVDQFIKLWWREVRKQNGSMAGVYQVYFGTSHPITWRAQELGI